MTEISKALFGSDNSIYEENLEFFTTVASNASKKMFAEHCEERRVVSSSNSEVLQISVGRLQMLQKQGRRMLSGKFTRRELITLWSVFERYVFTPNAIVNLANRLRPKVRAEETQELMEKITNLSLIEKVALADFIERLWYGADNGYCMDEIAHYSGIKIAG